MIESKYINSLIAKAKNDIKTIVLPEGEDERVLIAAHLTAEDGFANIIVLGNEEKIKAYYKQKGWNFNKIKVIEPEKSERLAEYTELLYNLRKENYYKN